MWAAASQMRDHSRLITSYIADLTCVRNLWWTTTSGSPLRISSSRRQYFITTGAGCWMNIPELNKRRKWKKSNDELDGDIAWVLKDFRPRGIWLLGRIVKAHRGSDGIARSFDIQTARGIVQSPAVILSRVFNDCQVLRRFTETNSLKHVLSHTKTQCQNEKFFCFTLFCLNFHFKSLLLLPGV